MLREFKGLICGLLAVSSVGTVLMTRPIMQVQASNKPVSKVPESIRGNWYIEKNHMGKISHKKIVTLLFTNKYSDTRIWNTSHLTLKEDKARHRLSKHALKLVAKHVKPSQFMLEHVGKSLWNKYYITKSPSGKTVYVTDHYWVHAPVIDGVGWNNRLYTWKTTATHKFNTQPLRGKHAIVSWKTVKKYGTWYLKTP